MTDARVQFASTRGGAPAVAFEEALLQGPVPDGGLYVPVDIPTLPPDWRAAGSPADLALRVLPPFCGAAGAEAVAQALDFEIPLQPIGNDHVLELFHGPTAAFKDVGARSLARLMQLALSASGATATVLVATSGDTGSAVADAFAGLEGLQVALLYPDGGVSRVQEDQLTTARPGLRSFAVEGTFDDCQRMVKESFADPQLAPLALTSANSINVGRLLPQMLYYLWGALQVRRELGETEELTVVVPSGNLGNLTAGLLAQRMGLEGVRFVAAHNRNDYFVRFLAGGAEAYDFSASVATLSNAMDVGAPSNFERLNALFGSELRNLVTAHTVDDDTTLVSMRRAYEEFGYLACPHTAVGLEAWRRVASGAPAGRRAIVLATAHPAKFPEAVERATGVTPPVPPALARYAAAPKRVEKIPASQAALREALLARPTFSA